MGQGINNRGENKYRLTIQHKEVRGKLCCGWQKKKHWEKM